MFGFDERAALIGARLVSQGRVEEHPSSGFNVVVAAIAEANDCIVVTDNEKHFPGVKLQNPIRSVRDPEIS